MLAVNRLRGLRRFLHHGKVSILPRVHSGKGLTMENEDNEQNFEVVRYSECQANQDTKKSVSTWAVKIFDNLTCGAQHRTRE